MIDLHCHKLSKDLQCMEIRQIYKELSVNPDACGKYLHIAYPKGKNL